MVSCERDSLLKCMERRTATAVTAAADRNAAAILNVLPVFLRRTISGTASVEGSTDIRMLS